MLKGCAIKRHGAVKTTLHARCETEVSTQLSSLTILHVVHGGEEEGPPRTAWMCAKSHALVENRSPVTLRTITGSRATN